MSDTRAPAGDSSDAPDGGAGEAADRFASWRRRIGLAAALVAFVVVYFWPMSGLSAPAHRLAAIMAAVVLLWVSEALPLALTAVLGAAACVIFGVADAQKVFAPFADPLMFLFIGSFILARAIFLHGLDRRLAFGVLSLKWVGARPGRILFAFGAVTAFLSAWISNTAATAMMFAIGLSILGFFREQEKSGGPRIDPRFATGMMLMTSFSASIGGLATPVGTPPNIIGLGYLRKELGVEIPFFQWMTLGVPAVIVLYLFLFAYLYFLCPAGVRHTAGGGELLKRQSDAIGPWTRGQVSTLIACLVAVSLWLLPGAVAVGWGSDSPPYKLLKESIPDAIPALLGAGLLFFLPGQTGRKAIHWNEAMQIDWGVILLYGGGFALGTLAKETGLADAIGMNLTQWLPGQGEFALLVVATLVATLVSEATSNTASANIVIPVTIAVARAAGVDPLVPALGATLGSSLGFMLPVSTPCNAIVYGSGLIPLGRMIRYGVLLDVAGVIVIVTIVKLVTPLWR
jgi:sodium-dependent dicarboxylate transporter 2/3/5